MGQTGTRAQDSRLSSPSPRKSGRECHGQRGGKDRAREVRILHFGGGRAKSLAPGAWPPSPRGALLPTPRHGRGHPALLPAGSRAEAPQMDAPLRLTVVRIGPKLPAAASDKMEDATTVPPPPPAAPPGAMSATDMAPSPAAGGGRRASSGEGGKEALLGGAGCGGMGEAPSLGYVRSLPFPSWERFHYPRSVPHGNGPRFKALLGEGAE